MAGENTEVDNKEESQVMTGADDAINVEDTVADLAESLHLVEGEDKAEGDAQDKGAADDKGGKAPAETTDAAKPPAEGGTPPAAAAPAPTTERVPDTWRKEAKEKWAGVDPMVRAEITKREADVAKFVAEAQPSFEIARTAHKILEPYLPMMQRFGVDPLQHIGALLNAHTTLLFGDPATKAQMFRNMAQQAGIDLAQLASDPNSSAQANTQQLAYIRTLEQRVARMEQGVTGVTSQLQEGRAAELEQGIMAFAKDVENHPFFWELAESGEIKALIDTGAAKTLKDAYELALYRNPVTRAKQLDLDSKKAVAANAKLAADRAVTARRATRANVKSRGSGRAPAGEESIEDTLRSTLSDINSRH